MGDFFYYLGVTADSVLSVLGIRAGYEQPKYTVIGHAGRDVELRVYGALTAAETPVRAGNSGEAFGRLFRYIAGANRASRKIAMTVPVEEGASTAMAMTIPAGLTSGGDVMRLLLPRGLAANPPEPTDPLVHVVHLPPREFAVLRFSGTVDDASRDRHAEQLQQAVAAAGLKAAGPPWLLSYDPPFAIPFVRRNEVAVPVEGDAPVR